MSCFTLQLWVFASETSAQFSVCLPRRKTTQYSYKVCFFLLLPGGNSGIGKDTAVALAMRGARVIIACRDAGKAEKAVREIKFKSHCLNVFHMELDLANLQSVREFCRSFLQREKRLDILINNAGERPRSASAIQHSSLSELRDSENEYTYIYI